MTAPPRMLHALPGRQAAAPGAAQPICRLAGVRKVYDADGDDPVVAIDEVSFEVEQGELIALLGPSGCGKTTVLRIIGGLTRASEGIVQVRGQDVTGPQPSFGFVFQSPTLMPWRTVLDNVLFPMEILRRNDARARERALELLSLVGLDRFERRLPRELSGGMRQRVALCRGLIHEPSMLLMDEPFGSLDELTRMEMQDLLLEVRRVTNTTVIFVTHSINEAIYLADQVLVLSKRPARVARHIRVDLPYPRNPSLRYTEAFTALQRQAGVALGITR